MKKAWIENSIVRDICHGDPAKCYHPDVASLYDTDVPDEAVNGATLIAGVCTNPPPPTAAELAADLARLQQRDAELIAAQRESKCSEIRDDRDLLLAKSDWTQCADISAAVKTKWVPYRKALRDVPQQAGFPFNVIWPT